ncbi:MAG: hemolysin III family protein [Lachnospiraceae bacterium]|nr:hemolysin III family protein [Lachnospiraceae bacterium]
MGTFNATKYGLRPCSITIKVREPGSAFTHGAGLLLLLMGAGPLVMKASLSENPLTVFSMWTFILSACLLYGASTVYHWVVLDEKKTRILRKVDHMSIAVLIAGTYTPVCLTALKGRTGYILLTAIWILAILAIALKALWVTCPKWLSSSVYLLMGWMCVAAFPLILKSLPLGAFLWLLSGGVLYSAGAVIYAKKFRIFDKNHIYFGSHEIFHCFIMAGTFCHYMLMFLYLA